VADRPLAEEWEDRAQAWVAWARTPDHDRYFHRFNWPAFLDLVPGAGRATLDLGCGEGRAGARLRELGHRLTGIDSAPTLAALAQATGAYVEVCVADAARLPFPDASFDLVIAFMSLQDMDDAAGALRETARVLEPDGRLVAAFVHPIASAHLGRAEGERRPYFETARTADAVERAGLSFTFHQVHRSLQNWMELFSAAGFVVERMREPRPSEATVDAEPALAKARVLPAFLHVCARRG
jgi:ubiquinone/menaquinone biosynthesis C-methylase UbiE